MADLLCIFQIIEKDFSCLRVKQVSIVSSKEIFMNSRYLSLPLLFFAFALFVSCTTNADYTVSGIVIDAATKKPIEGVIVNEGQYAPKLVAGDRTNSDGFFSYLTYPEEHNIYIECPGYETLKKTIAISNNDENMRIELIPEKK